MKNYRTIKDIVEQLEFCKYEANEGHPLEMNTAFQRLKVIAELNYQPKFQINEKVVHKGEVYYIRGMEAVSSSHPNCEVEYSLSKEFNHESTSNKTALYPIHENELMSFEEFENSEIEKAKALLIAKGIISA